jgi:hypothetical protein
MADAEKDRGPPGQARIELEPAAPRWHPGTPDRVGAAGSLRPGDGPDGTEASSRSDRASLRTLVPKKGL